MDDVSKIAKGLSESQRNVLLWAWPYPDYHRNGPHVSLCPVTHNSRQDNAMDRKGLTACKAEGGPRLTPLGLAVRKYLQEQET